MFKKNFVPSPSTTLFQVKVAVFYKSAACLSRRHVTSVIRYTNHLHLTLNIIHVASVHQHVANLNKHSK